MLARWLVIAMLAVPLQAGDAVRNEAVCERWCRGYLGKAPWPVIRECIAVCEQTVVAIQAPDQVPDEKESELWK